MPKELTASVLDNLYNQASNLDEVKLQRFMSYGRIANGDQYSNYDNNSPSRYNKKANGKSRLRLTQNHIVRFANTWTNAILNVAPDVEILPDNAREEKDKKIAELNRSVKAHIVESTDFYSLNEELVNDFVVAGEAIIKMTFEANEGPLVPGNIQEAVDPQGNPILVQDLMPSGLMNMERIDPENFLRDPAAKTWKKVRWVCHRHLMDKKLVIEMIKSMYGEDEHKILELINSLEEVDESLSAYKGTDNTRNYAPEVTKVSIREFFWKPCLEYPKGKYVMCTRSTKIIESELPGSIFPFAMVNFESNHGTPRGESRIKQLIPVQKEINRCISKMGEHQITLGDDKIITTAGSKIAEIKKYEGVRHFQVSGGQVPSILEGRAGTQYMEYYLRQLDAFDRIAELVEVDQDKLAGLDPYAAFTFSATQKKKYAKHAAKYERFLIDLWDKALRIFKFHVHPNAIIPVVGSSEKINVQEYKDSEDLGFSIKLKSRSGDPDSLAAKQFQLNQVLQYTGSNMDEADIGVIMKESPFLDKVELNTKAVFKTERAQNLILRLDKGMDMPVSQADDPDFMLQRMDTRMSNPDFDHITYRLENGQVIPTEYIHQLYNNKRQEYIQIISEREEKRLAEQAGKVPTTGAMIPIQMYDSKINSDGEITTKRIQLPNDTLEWVINLVKQQGMTESTLGQFAPNSEMDIRESMDSEATALNQASIMGTNADGMEGL